MTRSVKAAIAAIAFVGVGTLPSACARTEAPAPAASAAAAQTPARTKEQNIDLGRQHKTAAELYRFLREQAQGGKPLSWTALPDWRGVYTRAPVAGFAFDPDTPPGGLPTAKLTPEYQA